MRLSSPAILYLLILCDLLLCHPSFSFFALAANSEQEPGILLPETNATASGNASLARSNDDSFANMIDRALEREFPENEQNEGTDAGSFNNSVAGQQAVLETVARVKSKKNESREEKSFQFHDVFNLDNENRAEDMPTLIDRKDNVFIISNPKSKYPILQLDLRLISDLVVVIVSATCGGIAFACAGQPVMTGYLLAGSIIGPGGLSFVSEMVQVETVAQFGVIFLLFALGLEFSTTKLRVVRAVAILGGLLQIFLFMCLCGITASLCGGKSSEGIFVGAFLSMSSTAVVLKFLMERNSVNALHGQVTIGTLILQDCAVGLLFALIPVLGGTSGVGSFPMVEPIRNFFAALFLASIGMLIHVHFLWNHVDILLAAVILVIIIKTIVAASVVKGFGYNNKTSLLVGMSLAQIGEFAFVLLSRASNLHLVEGKLYLLLLGTTALSLVIYIHYGLLASCICSRANYCFKLHRPWGQNEKHDKCSTSSEKHVEGCDTIQSYKLAGNSASQHEWTRYHQTPVSSRARFLCMGLNVMASFLQMVQVTTPLLFKLIPAVVHLGALLRWFPPDSPSEVFVVSVVLRILNMIVLSDCI
ncbi:Sodium/solute symporter superfamily [Sesbania bispinosa]|nr:Sodium/solute symporter superfamily [Sesbania bispinosa]